MNFLMPLLCTDCIIDYCSYSMGNDMSVLLFKQCVEHVKTLIYVSDVLGM